MRASHNASAGDPFAVGGGTMGAPSSTFAVRSSRRAARASSRVWGVSEASQSARSPRRRSPSGPPCVATSNASAHRVSVSGAPSSRMRRSVCAAQLIVASWAMFGQGIWGGAIGVGVPATALSLARWRGDRSGKELPGHLWNAEWYARWRLGRLDPPPS